MPKCMLLNYECDTFDFLVIIIEFQRNLFLEISISETSVNMMKMFLPKSWLPSRVEYTIKLLLFVHIIRYQIFYVKYIQYDVNGNRTICR